MRRRFSEKEAMKFKKIYQISQTVDEWTIPESMLNPHIGL